MFAQLVVDGRSVGSLRERYGEQTCRFVRDNQLVVLVQDLEATVPKCHAAASCAARSVDPHAHHVAGANTRAAVAQRRFRLVDEDFALCERVGDPAARSETVTIREKLVEPSTFFAWCNRPRR